MNDRVSFPVSPANALTDIQLDVKVGDKTVPMTLEAFGTRTWAMKGETAYIDVRKLEANGVDVTGWLEDDDFASAFYNLLYRRD